ncbi:MAG: putative Ig domain-containing protein, partial [Bacteroidota bacterium]
IGAASGLPAGLSASFASNTITISGTPTASGTFNYTVPLTGGCGTVSATGTITITPNNTVSAPSSNPTACIGLPLSPTVTFTTTGATGIGSALGLPAGLSASFSSNTITISGTPTAAGTFNYTIPLTGGCGTVSATGTITITPNNTVSAPSSNPTVCIGLPLSPTVTFTTTGATGIGAASGLPAGLSASFSSNSITISGTPTASGTFNYSIPLTGGCGTVSATGTITVTPNNTVTAPSSNPSVCIGLPITPVTYTTTGATGIGVATGLPAGVSATWFGNTITVSGTPTTIGTFNYTIPLTGGCGIVNATGTITVNDLPVITLTPDDPNACNAADGSILVNGSGNGNVIWTGPSSGNANGVALNYSVSGLAAGTYAVYFVDANGCQSSTLQASLANPGAPVLDIINDVTNCGTSYTLPAISGTSLNVPAYYTGPGGTGSVVASGTVYNAPTNVTLYAYDANGSCIDEEPFNIIINQIPTVNDPADVLVCPGASINPDDFVSNPSGATFAWSNTDIAIGLPLNGAGQIATYNAPVNNTGSVVSGTVTVTPTLSGCVGTAQTFLISISPTPTVNDPADVTVCPGSTVDPVDFVSNPVGATFTWSNSNPANGLAANGSDQIIPY